MKSILVTGASGFIGRALIRELLADGHEVHVIGRTPLPGTVPHQADLLSPHVDEKVRKIGATHLVHCAWVATPGLYWTTAENLDWVAASLAIARGFAAGGGKRLIGVGTCAEYRWGEDPLDEARSPITPSTLYGSAKASLGRLLNDGAPALGLSVAWARIFFPYGPWERPQRLLGTLLSAMVSGGRAAFGPGLQSRDFIHVDDVASALAALLRSTLSGAINVGTGEAIEVRRFIRLASVAAGMTDRIDLGATAAGADEAPIVRASLGRLRDELGWTPKFTIEDGISDAVSRFRNGCSPKR